MIKQASGLAVVGAILISPANAERDRHFTPQLSRAEQRDRDISACLVHAVKLLGLETRSFSEHKVLQHTVWGIFPAGTPISFREPDRPNSNGYPGGAPETVEGVVSNSHTIGTVTFEVLDLTVTYGYVCDVRMLEPIAQDLPYLHAVHPDTFRLSVVR